MIRPIDLTQLIVILYTAIAIVRVMYYIAKFDDFKPFYILLAIIWPVVLWCELLILILSIHGEYKDRRSYKNSKNKPDFFATYKGEIPTKPKSDVEQFRKGKPKRVVRRNDKMSP